MFVWDAHQIFFGEHPKEKFGPSYWPTLGKRFVTELVRLNYGGLQKMIEAMLQSQLDS